MELRDIKNKDEKAKIIAESRQKDFEADRRRIRSLSKKIERNPTALDYFKRGSLFACIRLYPEAIADLKSSLKIDPEFKPSQRVLFMLKREYAFHKKGLKVKKHIEKLRKEGKLKIDKRRRNWYGDFLYAFKDKNGKEVTYNLTYDTLQKYGEEEWLI